MTRVRVATWNANGRFRDKVSRALALNADITVVQEAEDPERYAEQLADDGAIPARR